MNKLSLLAAVVKKSGPSCKRSSYADITVILPTLNEGKNIYILLKQLIFLYKNCYIIVTDDGSTDNTEEACVNINYDRLIFLNRSKKITHGLTASVLDAIGMVKTDYFIVMDADGQHPADKVGEIANMLRLKNKVVVASRSHIQKGWGLSRKGLSSLGALIGIASLLAEGKNYIGHDILSGFFGCPVQFWKNSISSRADKTSFRLKGYKIVFDFLKLAPTRLDIEKVYYNFKIRKADISKLRLHIYLEYLKACLSCIIIRRASLKSE